MLFNYNNKNEIDEIYIHDSYFDGLSYNYQKRQVEFSCENPYLKKMFHFSFFNVIWFNMQSCGFWHGGMRILWLEYEENSSAMESLLKTQNSNLELYQNSYLDKDIHYICINFQINSGDTLLIICQSFEFLENDLVVTL